MAIKVMIPTRQITFSRQELEDWKAGKRDDCPEGYCKHLPGSYGFGEQLVGKYFASQGYQWIHHDFNIFGGNKLGKYPEAERIIMEVLGPEKYERARTFYTVFTPLEEPDLLIYKPDLSELRFVETKRVDTHDRIRGSQVNGLALLSLLFGCEVELFEVVPVDVVHVTESLQWIFGDVGV